MSKGTILFKELSMPFDFITASVESSVVLIFIPYSDKDMIRLIENDLSFNVIENIDNFKGKHLVTKVSLSDIKFIIFEK